MRPLAHAGLTTPAVAGPGCNEGLGVTLYATVCWVEDQLKSRYPRARLKRVVQILELAKSSRYHKLPG